jgi:hypothetical protein
MALIDKVDFGAGFVNSAVRATNTSGAMIVSVAENPTGELIADEYALALDTVAGGTGRITVVTSSPNNPYNGRIVNGVPLDGVTPVKTIVPGLSIVFSAGGANGNASTVFAGLYLGVFDAFGVEAGVPSDGVRHKVTNNGTGAVSDAKALLLTEAVQVKKVGTVFDFVAPFADGATVKVLGGGSNRIKPYALKTVNVAGAGAGKTADLQVDGVTVAADFIMDLTTGTLHSGVGLKAISPGYKYRFVDGPLEGLEFSLSSLCATNDIANVLIFPAAFTQIAPDVAGVAGAYAAVEVPLTQVGQAAGVIQPAQDAYYWERTLVPLGGNAESNPYPANIALQASETGAADWTG